MSFGSEEDFALRCFENILPPPKIACGGSPNSLPARRRELPQALAPAP
jgi:hypothetical protein